MIFRPLLKIGKLKEDCYLPMDYAFSPNQIAKIKKYIPKSLTFIGVDAQTSVEQSRPDLDKQKLKIKAVAGKQLTTNSEISFYADENIALHLWENVFICLNIHFNNRQNIEDQKEQIQSKLSNFISSHICFKNKRTNQLIDKSSLQSLSLPLTDVDLYFEPTMVSPESFDNSCRELRFQISIITILPFKPVYTISEIYESIEEDILSSLKIMIKNQLCIRIVKSIKKEERILVLQSFVGNKGQIANEQQKLLVLINQHHEKQELQLINKQQLLVNNQQNSLVPRRQLSNQQLLLILLGLFFIYLFLKINPIQRIVEQL